MRVKVNVMVKVTRAVLVAIAMLACNRPIEAPSDSPATQGDSVGDDGDPIPPDTSPTSASAATSGWTIEADDAGFLRIRNRNADVFRGSYAFFLPDYKWTGAEHTVGKPQRGTVESKLQIAGLGVTGTSRLTVAEHDQTAVATMAWQLNVAQPLRNVSGGGLEMQATLVPGLWGGTLPTPEYADDGRRLTLGKGAEALVFELEGDAAVLTAVPGRPGLLRVVLLGGDVPAGARNVTLKVTLPTGGKVRTAARHEVPGADWQRNIVVYDGAPVDLSFLQDKPAGKHGRVEVDGEGLRFADGTPARFWGTNVVAYALFDTDRASIARQAKRISALGFNLVRLHHHDSAWVSPNIFEADGRRLRKESLESLDWWIKCLTDEGIYVWLDVHVGRQFRMADGIAGFAELPNGDGRGFSYINPRIIALMDQFAAAYLDRKNVHTGRRIADDPALAIVQITNENDITHHFGSMLSQPNRPVHQALYRARAEAFAKRTGVPLDKAVHAWELGPGKLMAADVEAHWAKVAMARLRKLGVRAPLSTTSMWGDNGMYALPSLTVGDVVDVHSYGGPDTLSANPRYEPNVASGAGVGAVLGKPHTLSEHSVPPPAVDRHVGPLYMAAISAFQSWDAPLLFAYSQEAGQPRSLQQFAMWVDPSLIAVAPAAALLYRRQDVAPAKRRIVLAPSATQIYGAAHTVWNSAALRTGLEQSQVVVAVPDAPELEWDRAPPLDAERKRGSTIVTNLDQDLLAAEATTIVSDTGELTRDFIEGRWIVGAPQTQVASGWIGGTKIELADGWVQLENPSATFALTSLDGPIATSKKILVTAVGPAEPIAGGGGTFWSAPIRGTFAVRTKLPLKMVPLSAKSGWSGGPLAGRVATPGKRDGDMLVFELGSTVQTHWWVLRAD